MNIQKTNPLALSFINKNGFLTTKIPNLKKSENYSQSEIYIRDLSIIKNESFKIFRFSKKTIEDAKKISFESIKKNLDKIDLNSFRAFIMLDNDINGFIEYAFIGSDIIFSFVSSDKTTVKSYCEFSLLTNEFSAKINEGEPTDDDILPIKLLVYLCYGDITTKFISPKEKIKLNSFSYFLNNSSLKINYVDSNWKQRIKSENPFLVIGHFRLQPFGLKKQSKRLIWIENFMKKGYNRSSGMENIK